MSTWTGKKLDFERKIEHWIHMICFQTESPQGKAYLVFISKVRIANNEAVYYLVLCKFMVNRKQRLLLPHAIFSGCFLAPLPITTNGRSLWQRTARSGKNENVCNETEGRCMLIIWNHDSHDDVRKRPGNECNSKVKRFWTQSRSRRRTTLRKK